MTAVDTFQILLPFGIAFAMTHLIVLPFKSFFLEGDLRKMAARATVWNLMALGYSATMLFLFGIESPDLVWGAIKYLPTLLVFALSIGIWLTIMVRATKKYMLIDVAVFTILAMAAA
jgi:hypothetical protein